MIPGLAVFVQAVNVLHRGMPNSYESFPVRSPFLC